MLICAQPWEARWATVTPPTCRNQFQTYPEVDGYEPRGGSNLTGPGLCNEMRTVSEYDWWRKRNVRVMRTLELLFFPERQAPFEDLDPGCWRRRGSCQLVVEDFQDAKLCTYNSLNCPRCVQRRRVAGLDLARSLAIAASRSASGRVCPGI